MSKPRSRVAGRRTATALLASTALLVGGAAAPSALAQSTADQYGTAGATGSVSTSITRVDFTTFGSIDPDVRRDVVTALERAGLPFRALRTTNDRIARFADGDVARSLSTAGPRPLGRAVGRTLTSAGPQAPSVFRALFVTDEPFRPVVASVVTRTENISTRQDRFSRGVAEGFATAVPTVYVERSDDDTSHVDEFRDLPGVSVVDDVDTDAGKRRLVALLTRSGGGARTTSAAGGGGIDADTTSAIAGAGDGGGTAGPIALLAVLGGAVLFVAAGLGRRRTHRAR